jgi:hypothetical protein
MYFKFGSYQHPDNEVNLTTYEVTTQRSPRGRPMKTTIRLHINGQLQAAGQSALNTKIAELIDVYSQSNMDQDCGLYHDDGTVTRHKLESSNTNSANLTGVRLVHRSWPRSEPEEYATCRSFYIVLEAVYRDLESQLIDFHERLYGIGTTAPAFLWTLLASGRPKRQMIHTWTLQTLVQEGYATGFDGWPVNFLYGPGPLFPALEDQERRTIYRTGPRYLGRAFANYRIDWRYIMHSDTDLDPYPHII